MDHSHVLIYLHWTSYLGEKCSRSAKMVEKWKNKVQVSFTPNSYHNILISCLIFAPSLI